MVNSKRKGKGGELELVHKLNELGFSTRRTAQYNGKENGSLADLVGIEGVHIEAKRVERLNIDTAMEQAIRGSKEDEVPMVFHRRNRKGWLVTMPIEVWAEREKKFQEERNE
jgi:Holliday junction resolvase